MEYLVLVHEKAQMLGLQNLFLASGVVYFALCSLQMIINFISKSWRRTKRNCIKLHRKVRPAKPAEPQSQLRIKDQI